jgi:hypothetical protein
VDLLVHIVKGVSKHFSVPVHFDVSIVSRGWGFDPRLLTRPLLTRFGDLITQTECPRIARKPGFFETVVVVTFDAPSRLPVLGLAAGKITLIGNLTGWDEAY